MFNFFHTILIKITSAIAGVVISVGIISAPQPVITPIKYSPTNQAEKNITKIPHASSGPIKLATPQTQKTKLTPKQDVALPQSQTKLNEPKSNESISVPVIPPIATSNSPATTTIYKLLLTSEKTNISLAPFHGAIITASSFKDGQPTPLGALSFFVPDGKMDYSGFDQCSCKVTFDFFPDSIGKKVISVTTNGVTESITIDVGLHTSLDDAVEEIKYDPNLLTNQKDQTIGSFKISLADEPETLDSFQFSSSIPDPHFFRFCTLGQCYESNSTTVPFPPNMLLHPDQEFTIKAADTLGYLKGYSIQITQIKTSGKWSQKSHSVSGLPFFAFNIFW